jgi:tetratricopeptide (TPR) repeat protein
VQKKENLMRSGGARGARRGFHPPGDPAIAQALYQWGIGLAEKGDARLAVEALREALQIQHRYASDGDAEVVGTRVALGWALTGSGQAKEAEPLLRDCLEIRRRILPAGHWQTASSESLLGACLTALGRYTEAEPLLLHAQADLQAVRDLPPARLRQARRRIVQLYEAWGKPKQAAAWRAKVSVTEPAGK